MSKSKIGSRAVKVAGNLKETLKRKREPLEPKTAKLKTSQSSKRLSSPMETHELVKTNINSKKLYKPKSSPIKFNTATPSTILKSPLFTMSASQTTKEAATFIPVMRRILLRGNEGVNRLIGRASTLANMHRMNHFLRNKIQQVRSENIRNHEFFEKMTQVASRAKSYGKDFKALFERKIDFNNSEHLTKILNEYNRLSKGYDKLLKNFRGKSFQDMRKQLNEYNKKFDKEFKECIQRKDVNLAKKLLIETRSYAVSSVKVLLDKLESGVVIGASFGAVVGLAKFLSDEKIEAKSASDVLAKGRDTLMNDFINPMASSLKEGRYGLTMLTLVKAGFVSMDITYEATRELIIGVGKLYQQAAKNGVNGKLLTDTEKEKLSSSLSKILLLATAFKTIQEVGKKNKEFFSYAAVIYMQEFKKLPELLLKSFYDLRKDFSVNSLDGILSSFLRSDSKVEVGASKETSDYFFARTATLLSKLIERGSTGLESFDKDFRQEKNLLVNSLGKVVDQSLLTHQEDETKLNIAAKAVGTSALLQEFKRDAAYIISEAITKDLGDLLRSTLSGNFLATGLRTINVAREGIEEAKIADSLLKFEDMVRDSLAYKKGLLEDREVSTDHSDLSTELAVVKRHYLASDTSSIATGFDNLTKKLSKVSQSVSGDVASTVTDHSDLSSSMSVKGHKAQDELLSHMSDKDRGKVSDIVHDIAHDYEELLDSKDKKSVSKSKAKSGKDRGMSH
jgi:hypothetical protein